MDELPHKAAELLAAARRNHEPSRADSERVRTLLAATIAVPGKLESAGLSSKTALGAGKGASGFLSSAIGKAVLVLSLAGGAALGIHAVSESAAPETRASQRSVRVAHVHAPVTARSADPELALAAPSVGAVEAHESVRDEPSAVDAPAQVREPEPAPSEEPRPRSRVGKPSAVKVKAADAPQAGASEPAEAQAENGEIALIRGALAHLKAGTAQEALALLGLHAARYPNGVMSEERDGLRAIALCRTFALSEGVAAQQSFLRVYPSSTMAARVRKACSQAAR